MASSTHLTDSEILSKLGGELNKLASETAASIQDVEWEIKRQTQWLEERCQYWKREVDRCQREVNNYRQQLHRCEASRGNNGNRNGPSCESERQALKRAEQCFTNGLRELNNVQHWTQVVNQACEEFRAQSSQFRTIAENAIPKGKALLKNKEQAIQKYGSAGRSDLFSFGSSANNGTKGSDFEQWARDNVFKGVSRRLRTLIVDNTHLDKYGDGIGLTKDRMSDAFVDEDGSIWELKSGYESGGIDQNQLDEYTFMVNSDHVYIRDGEQISKVKISSINYLFQSENGAKANAKTLDGKAEVWFVDPDGIVHLFG